MTEREVLKLALEALEVEQTVYVRAKLPMPVYLTKAITALRQALEQQPADEPVLWLWRNFVNGRPEYWAFNNPFPCVSVGGDPLTLGEPCGWALLKTSVNGRPDRSEQEVIDKVTRLANRPQPAAWVGLTDEDLPALAGDNGKVMELQQVRRFAKVIEAKLKEKNT